MADKPAAVAGDLSDYRYVRTRKVFQIVVEVPIEQALQAQNILGALNPESNVPVAIARIADPSKPAESKPELTDGEKAVQMAGILCQDADFQKWLSGYLVCSAARARRCEVDLTPDEAAEVIRDLCHIGSRAALATVPEALARWHKIVGDYRVHQQYGDQQ